MAADRPLLPDEKVVALGDEFERAGIPYAFGGAIALLYWSEPRGTVDIDINVFLPVSSPEAAFDAVSRLGIAFNREDAAREIETQDQIRLDWGGTFVDLFFAHDPLHDSCRERAVTVDFLGHQFKVLSAEDLVIFKAVFNRGKDWIDIEQLLAIQAERFDTPYVRRWLARIVGEDDARIARLETLTRTYCPPP